MEKLKLNFLNLALAAFFMLVFGAAAWGQGWERVYDLPTPGNRIFNEQNGGFLAIAGVGSPGFFFTDEDGEIISGWGNSLIGGRDLIQSQDGNMVGLGWEFGLAKFSKTGDLMWETTLGFPGEYGNALFEDADGNFVMAGSKNISTNHTLVIIKADANGNQIWRANWSSLDWPSVGSIVAAPGGGYFVSVHHHNADEIVVHVDEDGTILNTFTSNLTYSTQMLAHPNGGYMLFGGEQDATQTDPSYDLCLIRLDEDLNQVWKKTFSNSSSTYWGDWPVHMELTSDGGFAMIANSEIPPGNREIWLVKTDDLGNEQWSRSYGGVWCDEAADIIQTPDNGYAIIGHTDMQIPNIQCEIYDLYIIRTDSLGNTFPFVLDGHVRYDIDDDCIVNPADEGLNQWILSIENGSDTTYRVTNSDGYYSVNLDTGEYEVKVIPPNAVWTLCEDSIVVDLDGSVDTAHADFSVRTDYQCPYLEVDISMSLLRPCKRSYIHGTVFNYGSEMAEDAFVEITLDDHLAFVSSLPPVTSQTGNVYTIDLGDIDFNTGTFFNMTLDVECDTTFVGQTLCAEAHIFPDTTCIPFDPSWSGADLVASVVCNEDESTVDFTIENVGTGDMDGPLPFIVIEDDAIMMEGEEFELLVGEQFEKSVSANGSFYRLEADQEPFHPSQNHFIASFIEGCGTNSSGEISLGFVNQFPLPDADPYLDQECREVVAAYDPNIKMSFTEGFSEQHLIEKNVDLEYVIHFQNTGTDTAFNVMIKDTLSPYLNLATVRPGASSHPYEFEITGERTLKFRFPNILLPDSTTNEEASHGFVSFKVSQQPGLENGTVIYNDAAIYFDIFSPVITNETYHTIGEKFIEVILNEEEPEVQVDMKVYPNPFVDYTNFEIPSDINETLKLVVFDLNGRILDQQSFESNILKFDGRDLSAGIYFFRIEAVDQILSTGKLIVQ